MKEKVLEVFSDFQSPRTCPTPALHFPALAFEYSLILNFQSTLTTTSLLLSREVDERSPIISTRLPGGGAASTRSRSGCFQKSLSAIDHFNEEIPSF